jgi:hypothetical protein
MTAAETLKLAHEGSVSVSLVGEFIRWQSRGEMPPHVLAALRAAKPEIVALLRAYALDASGALAGEDGLLRGLARLGFCVRRYGDQAALDDDTRQGRVPPMPLVYAFAGRQSEYGALLCAFGAKDRLGKPHEGQTQPDALAEPSSCRSDGSGNEEDPSRLRQRSLSPPPTLNRARPGADGRLV